MAMVAARSNASPVPRSTGTWMLPKGISSEITSGAPTVVLPPGRPRVAAAGCRSVAAAAPARRAHRQQRVVRLLGRPGDALEHHRLDLRVREVAVVVPLHPD